MAAAKDHINLRPAVLVVALLICFGIFTGCKPDPAPSSSKGTSSVKTGSTAVSSPASGSSALPSSAAPSSSKAASSRPPASSSLPPSSVPPASSSQPSSVSSKPETVKTVSVERFYDLTKELHIALTYFEYPAAIPPQKHPLVIFFHDGAWDNPKDYTGLDPTLTYARDEFLKLGYAVASCQYLRETGANQFPKPVEAASEALRYIASVAAERNLDPQRVILMGKGAGAHTALMAAFAESREGQTPAVKVQAVVALSALTSLERLFKYSDPATPSTPAKQYEGLRGKVENYLGLPYTSGASVYKDASPLEKIHKNIPYCFLFANETMYRQQAEALSLAVSGDMNEVLVRDKNTPKDIFDECMVLIRDFISDSE